ncbi:MAG: SDR family NAD(P)-dependent oxidoreductase [Verrucomicrobiota bacterium]
MQLKNKKILIIGGSSGIGFSIATAAAENGAQVIIAGRDETKLKASVAKLTANGGQVEGRQLNAFIEAELNSFFENLTTVDHLV